MTTTDDPRTDDAIARGANATNNAMHQDLRLERWEAVRDSLWNLMAPVVPFDARIALVGGGSCDDVPLVRLLDRASHIDLIDFDSTSTARALARVPDAARERIGVIEHDVTGGSADMMLRAVRDQTELPDALPLPYDALGSGDYDVVVGDMLYTQLLHAGLIALEVFGDPQRELMRRYDPPLVNALVQRIQASLAPGGHAVHVHDVACWTAKHTQPMELDDALRDPEQCWTRLARHDDCDPFLHLGRIEAEIVDTAWWGWPFEPNKQFLVRGTVARADVGSGSELAGVFRRG